jgi:hypothetical protein
LLAWASIPSVVSHYTIPDNPVMVMPTLWAEYFVIAIYIFFEIPPEISLAGMAINFSPRIHINLQPAVTRHADQAWETFFFVSS